MERNRNSGPVTIRDVAVEAGVATSTVSRAFARPGRVSASTAAKVFRAAERLGYRQDPVERLATDSRTALVAAVVADVMNPVFAAMVKGINAEALRSGYGLVLVDANESADRELSTLTRFLDSVDGLLFAGSRMSDVSIRHLAGVRPTFVLNRHVPGVSSVIAETRTGLEEAIDHLAGLGHTAITYLAGPAASWEDGMRWRSVADRCGSRTGLRVRRLGPFPPTLEGGARAFQRWREHPTTAVIAYNDIMAIGFIRKAISQGVAVPADVSVVGYDDIPYAQLVSPALTSVAVDQFQVGVAAARNLIMLIEFRSTRSRGVRDVRVPAQLVVRDSTREPPGAIRPGANDGNPATGGNP